MLRKPDHPSKLGRAIAALACLVSVTWLIGCGGDPNLADVRGVVKLDGKPLPNAFIIFTPEDAGPESTGTATFGKTDVDGNYRMFFSDDEYGATLGRNLVSIKTGDVSSDGDGPGVKEVVPNVYNKNSTLSVDVKSGSNKFDFDLESDASNIDKFRDNDK